MELTREITVNINGTTYELPKRTPAIAKKFGEFNNSFNTFDDVKIHYMALEVIEKVLGEEAIEEIFGTTDKDEISTIDSLLVVKELDNAYMNPVVEQQMRQVKDTMKPMENAVGGSKVLSELIKHA